MSDVEKITGSVLSVVNENFLALASMKLDFSLIKIEAPKDYSEVGTALSFRRKKAAEEGALHKTARRLGALFEQLSPDTPMLISAHGKRISEILKSPGVNPKPSPSFGPFAAFVGADATAAWAAATSGIPALSVYLLALMLARAWDAKEAVAIWVELVETRKKKIQDSFGSNHVVSESSLFGAQQDIPRQDLANWDASARAWLRTADTVERLRQDQLMLIVKNTHVPIDSHGSTYEKVIRAWLNSLQGMEHLLCGRPQSITNGATILGLAAWHIYPDLVVLGSKTTNISFNDKLVPQTGVGTIGIQSQSPVVKEGIRWSLALSHLRFYGQPFTAESVADFSRVTIEGLHIIALGSLMFSWGIRRKDSIECAKCFHTLWLRIEMWMDSTFTNPTSLSWLGHLCIAARRVINAHPESSHNTLSLFYYGQRRATSFLVKDRQRPMPFIKLGNRQILDGFCENNFNRNEPIIACLRSLASDLGLSSHQAVIFTLRQEKFEELGSPWDDIIQGETDLPCHPYESGKLFIWEQATAVPHRTVFRKRGHSGEQKTELRHTRWLSADVSLFTRHESTGVLLDKVLKNLVSDLRQRGELGIVMQQEPSWNDNRFQWIDPPKFFNSTPTPCHPNGPGSACHEDCFDHGSGRISLHPVFSLAGASLCIVDNGEFSSGDVAKLRENAKQLIHRTICPKDLPPTIENPKVQIRHVITYLESIYRPVDDSLDSPFINGLHQQISQFDMAIPSLRALDVATSVFSSVKNTSISLRILDSTLSKKKWVPRALTSLTEPYDERNHYEERHFRDLTLINTKMAFACIANLDDGVLDLDPEAFECTIALAASDSIFVFTKALSDPIEAAQPLITRIAGNLGRPGTCLLVAPQDPQIRPPAYDYSVVGHHPWDLQLENSFKGTSMHLTFTDWSLPVGADTMRTIDHDVHMVESVISILDSGQWVADLDIMKIPFEETQKVSKIPSCMGHSEILEEATEYISIDNWEEILDKPEGIGVFRARGNWAARLAAVNILTQQKCSPNDICVLGECHQVCVRCLELYWSTNNHRTPKILIC